MDLVELVMLLMLMSCRAEVLSLHHFYHGVPVLLWQQDMQFIQKLFGTCTKRRRSGLGSRGLGAHLRTVDSAQFLIVSHQGTYQSLKFTGPGAKELRRRCLLPVF